MSEATTGQPESFDADKLSEPRKIAKDTEDLLADLDRFLQLSSDLQKCLSDITIRIKNSIEEVNTVESDLLKREQVLKGKELEWNRLIQELELFMTRLLARIRKDDADSASRKQDSENNSTTIKDVIAAPVPNLPETVPADEETPGVERGLDGPVNPSVESIREILLSQERRIESIHAYLKENLQRIPSEEFPGADNHKR